jgi:hypothetical protein
MSEAFERSYALPHGYSVTFSFAHGQPFEARWTPAPPQIRKAREQRKFFEAYRAARREFLEEIAAVNGGNVLVIDTDENLTSEIILAPMTH